MTVTVDGAKAKTTLVNLTPGQTYEISVTSVKGFEESDPSSGTVTTGKGAEVLKIPTVEKLIKLYTAVTQTEPGFRIHSSL